MNKFWIVFGLMFLLLFIVLIYTPMYRYQDGKKYKNCKYMTHEDWEREDLNGCFNEESKE